MPHDDAPYRLLTSVAESLEAIDQVIAEARHTLRIFDLALSRRGFNAPGRADKLRQFLLAGRAHRILIALHEVDSLERENARLLALLRQFPTSIQIHRTTAQARNASDPFVIADEHSAWHQLHHEQPRAIVALHSPPDALPLVQRFDEIWELSEPAVSATTLGL